MQIALTNKAQNKKSFFATPSKLAAVIQLFAAGTSLTIYLAALKLNGFVIPLLACVVGCALIATSLSVMCKMAVWWRYINFLFPLALWASLLLYIPAPYYLAGFLLLLVVYWNTFQSQVPFYPSSVSLWKLIVKIIPKNRSIKMIDIGSGLGDLILNVAKHRPNSEFSGIEIAPLPWLVSYLRAFFLKSKAKFLYKNYLTISLEEYDVVFAYLSPVAMPQLWKKACSEMRPGTLLISHEFKIPLIEPYKSLKTSKDSTITYIYMINKPRFSIRNDNTNVDALYQQSQW